jgi:hypothetical protein
MLISEKITLLISIWMVLVLFITGDSELEVFFILIILGFIVIKELTAHLTNSKIKFKMNVFILIFMSVFIILVINRILQSMEI